MFDQLSERFSDAFRSIRGTNKLSEENIETALKLVRQSLLEADVNFQVVKEFIARIKEQSVGAKVIKGVNPGQQFIKIVHDELAKIMGAANEELNLDRPAPVVVMVVGLNGHGKTTFSGKLAFYLNSKKKKNVLLVPADTFRPAAKDQLMTLAKNMSISCYDTNLTKSLPDIASEVMAAAIKEGRDVVIFDTAGRLHVDADLMKQLAQLKSALQAYSPEVLLVADAMTGQEAVNVAKAFNESVALTGVVLSKMDSDAKGGAALSIRHATGLPIKYISMGEKMKDLELFHPDRLAGRILDMGDVVTLVERAQENIDEKEAERMMKNMEKGQFTIEDFLKQMEMFASLGPMSGVLKMLPGMGDMMRQAGDLSGAESEMTKIKVMIQSMTIAERKNHRLIKGNRLQRIALGSGHPARALEDFLKKFVQMEKMIGPLMSMMKGGMPAMGKGMGAGAGFPGMPENDRPKKKYKGPWGGGFF